MNLLTPKIEVKELLKQEASLYENISTTPYGTALAAKVTEKLIKASDVYYGLYHAHRDYCGLGLFYQNNSFTLAVVNDGYAPGEPIANFDSKSEFTKWLALENDQSMSLYGEKFNNQTITKIRLEWYLEDKYSPVWNDYCAYVRTTL